MKKLTFRENTVVFESPDEILFSSKFQSKLYKFFYSKLPFNGDYKFFFDTDLIASEQSEINLLDEFQMSEIKNKKLYGCKDRKAVRIFQLGTKLIQTLLKVR